MARIKDKKTGYGRILDAWRPPPEAGSATGCIATSFTFSPVLFEEECLSRFLQLESDPVEDGACYIIEREEKLAQLVCASALVDQHHARGARSLRWDLLSCRVPRGIQHAKVSLLLWSNYARLIIGSGNLTEDACRRNQEVFGVLDYYPESPSPLSCLEETAAFLSEIVEYAGSGPASVRWKEFIGLTLEKCALWSATDAGSEDMHISFLGLSARRPGILENLKTVWGRKIPPVRSRIISPFFDPPEAPNLPARSIWDLLKPSGPVSVNYDLIGEDLPGENSIFLHAPQTLQNSAPKDRKGAQVQFRRLNIEANRPLHAKGIWLESDVYTLYMIGSSNFTSPGLGLGQNKNIEANLVYQSPPTSELEVAYLESTEIPEDKRIRFKPAPDDNDDTAGKNLALLPNEFSEASYAKDTRGEQIVRLSFNGTPPKGFALHPEEDPESTFFDETAWKEAGSPSSLSIKWTRLRPPAGFLVTWNGAPAPAWWPVNVISPADLPPPEELKNLPLDLLIEILTSARPPYRMIGQWLNRNQLRKRPDKAGLDALKRVDSSTFLLQRTRRVARALVGLREKLEAPCASRESLQWRLYGPIGAKALSEGLIRESRSDEEKCFLLAELALELGRVVPQSGCKSLNASDISNAIRGFIDQLRTVMPQESGPLSPELGAYVDGAFKEALK